MTTKLDFTGSQNGPSGAADGTVQSTFVINFRELDQSAFLLLSSPLELSSGSPSQTSTSLYVTSHFT